MFCLAAGSESLSTVCSKVAERMSDALLPRTTFVFALFGCATSAGQLALLSLLTYYSRLFGREIFGRINCAVYLPSLPIVLLQGRLDSLCDRRYSSATAFNFRIIPSFLIIIATLLALPFIPDLEGALLACAASIGISTGVVFGSVYQLLTFVSAEEQKKNTAFFAFGYQVATISRLLKSIGLFCKRALQKRSIFSKETYNFREPTNRSHPIPGKWRDCLSSLALGF